MVVAGSGLWQVAGTETGAGAVVALAPCRVLSIHRSSFVHEQDTEGVSTSSRAVCGYRTFFAFVASQLISCLVRFFVFHFTTGSWSWC